MIGLYIALGVLVLAGIFLFLLFPSGRRHEDIAKVGRYVAHRGFHDDGEVRPENSLAAAKAAVDEGFPIENDVHLSKDGVVMVFHDDTLNRMCGCDGKIEDMTYAELKKLKLARSEEKIPTLEEFLSLVDGKVPLLIEFKVVGGNTKALCEATDAILSAYTGTYLIQSFYPQVVRWYKKNRPAVARGQLSTHKVQKGFFGCLASNLLLNCLGRPDFISYNREYPKGIFLRLCRKLGAHLFGWTYRHPDEVPDKAFDTYIFENFDPRKKED